MMLAQCKSVVFFSPRRVVLLGKLLVPCDAPHALGVDHVALALDERVFVRGAAQTAQLMVSCDAPHALFVDHVALALYERVFAQIAQLVVPCDAPHALLVDHVALALDERVFAQIAIPHRRCALEARASHTLLCVSNNTLSPLLRVNFRLKTDIGNPEDSGGFYHSPW